MIRRLSRSWWDARGGTRARKHAVTKRPSVSIADHFAELSDPLRREGVYLLINFVVIAVCAVICGCDDFVSIAGFVMTKRSLLERFLDL